MYVYQEQLQIFQHCQSIVFLMLKRVVALFHINLRRCRRKVKKLRERYRFWEER